MDQEENMIIKLSMLLKADVEVEENKYIINKKRKTRQDTTNSHLDDPLELDVNIECCQNNEKGINKAEIYLLNEECHTFLAALIQHEIPLPTGYRQWQVGSSTIVCVCMESNELPVHFVERLSTTLDTIEEVNY